MREVFWIVMVLSILRPHSSLHMDLFNQYLADSGMFVPGHDGSPPIELDYEEYYTTKPTTTTISTAMTMIRSSTTTALSSTNLPTASTETSKAPDDMSVFQSSVNEFSYWFFVALLIIIMLFVFVVLCHINSDSYRRLHSQDFRKINMVLDNPGLESIAVLDVATDQMDIFLAKFVPRGIDGHILPVLREESQE